MPNAMQTQSNDIQAALNKKLASAPAAATFAANTGWTIAGNSIIKYGRIVLGTGLVTRAAMITVADNGEYTVGYVPAGFRPVANVHTTCSWQCLNTGLTPDKEQVMATTLRIVASDGAVRVVSNVTGQFRASGTGDYVSLSGLSWFTA